jgi:hypothetical protein
MDYYVFEFEGKTQKELYDEVLLKINTSYVSPKDVLSRIENVSISLNGIKQNLFSVWKKTDIKQIHNNIVMISQMNVQKSISGRH